MTSSVDQRIPLADLGAEYRALAPDIDAAVRRVLESGYYILGPETERFEAELASYIGVSQAIGVNSGTDAILLALRALDIGPGDEVIAPAMTFIGTVEPVLQLGARPVLVDIEPETFALSPEEVRKKISPATKAIIAVHLYGQPAPMDRLLAVAREAKIPVIEDMAQAIGSSWQGKKAGTFGHAACLSFFPTKNLGAIGDGGAVLTADEKFAQRIRKLRAHGAAVKYAHEEPGYNTRLDALQAAILSVKLRVLDEWNERRRRLAAVYAEGLRGLPLTLPTEAPGAHHTYHLYTVQCEQRDALRRHLDARRIETGLHYPAPLHLQPALASLGGREGDFPQSERLARHGFTLPLYPLLPEENVRHVCRVIREFLQGVHA